MERLELTSSLIEDIHANHYTSQTCVYGCLARNLHKNNRNRIQCDWFAVFGIMLGTTRIYYVVVDSISKSKKISNMKFYAKPLSLGSSVVSTLVSWEKSWGSIPTSSKEEFHFYRGNELRQGTNYEGTNYDRERIVRERIMREQIMRERIVLTPFSSSKERIVWSNNFWCHQRYVESRSTLSINGEC